MVKKRKRTPPRDDVVRQVDTFLEQSTALVIREAENLEAVESALLEARFAGGAEDVAASYLYLIPPSETIDPKTGLPRRPGIVGANSDFVNQMVRLLNATQRTKMTIADEPPVFQDTTADGPAVRCIVKAIDKATGDVRWGVKVETKRSLHADTIALVKAQKKALESLPNYDRRKVARRIVQFLHAHADSLRAHGIEPSTLVVAGMGAVSQWADLFARAKEKGVKPEAVRNGIRRATGKGLSEAKTAAEVGHAMKAADKVIEQGSLLPAVPTKRPGGSPTLPTSAAPVPQAPVVPPEDAAEREKLLHGIHDCLNALGTNPRVLAQSLKVQFGVDAVEALTVPQLRTFHEQLRKRLPENQRG